MIITCQFCRTALDVGNETRSVVVLCYRTNKCCTDHKQWANPTTRVYCAAEDEDARDVEKVTHVIQTDPPIEVELDQILKDQLLARGNHPDP